jgi:hypothetical protein
MYGKSGDYCTDEVGLPCGVLNRKRKTYPCTRYTMFRGQEKGVLAGLVFAL